MTRKGTVDVIRSDENLNSVVFGLKDQVGGLASALQVFESLGVNVVHIESRPSRRKESEYEILIDVECDNNKMDELVLMLRKKVSAINLKQYEDGLELPPQTPTTASFDFGDMTWFPRKIGDLDNAQNVLMYGSELDADHPGFKDPIYRKRRVQFAEIANSYKYGNPIPKVQYTPEEIKTWGTVFNELHKLYAIHACREYKENWPDLVKYCGYREDNIPQLQDVNIFLKRRTGFSLRPVAGYLTPRDFLAGLAFRVFHCTQYIRHSSDPFYTPEPDCCHELLGHMPLLANPSFAQFSQEIGLASLGASDDDVDKLATLYFFTVEFGLCKQDGQLRVYGAGLLSSVAELKHAVTATDKIKRFDPVITCKEECIITSYQNAYYYTDSFEEAKEKMRAYAGQIKKPFGLRYNPYTQSVEILSNAEKIAALVSELRGDLCIVSNALKKIHEQDETVDVEGITNLLHTGLPLVGTLETDAAKSAEDDVKK
ncbi:Tryptophan 5-hydroxylase, putative [Pediculus humanus corporis]|uniref:Tryptophan 5-hydroxylase 2 n=1 Tax=Pediculus humanus subsp. corporis TaxID=121224 RepID=E0VZU7_PEDHC|nr:Tryptophan 5-hydroxylase, putative [Pediculus humanus corporis]EEB18903.1 Tryptophan 5-hydroxylase, putative [Pediculus humanus corporis]